MAKKKQTIDNIKKTVNQQILDDAIRHAVYLEQFKAGQVRDLIKLFNKEIEPDMLKQIDSRLEGSLSRKRQEEVIVACNEICDAGYAKINRKLSGSLKDFSVTEAAWVTSALQKAVPLNIDFRTPSLSVLENLVTTSPINGQMMDSLLKTLSDSTKNKIAQQIRIGIVEGESVDAIVRRIGGTRANGYNDGVFAASRRSLKAIVRTSVSGVSNNVRDKLYAENDDVIKGVMYVATLDTRTTVTCAALDGQEFKIGEGPRPPMHINCRSTTVSVLKSWKELGIDLEEAPESTRASMNGQVPAKQNFGEWLKGRSVGEQEKILGVNKAKLFREGYVSSQELINQDYQPISLEKLKNIVGKQQQEIYNLKYEFKNNLGDIRLEYQKPIIKELDYLTKKYADITLNEVKVWPSLDYDKRVGKKFRMSFADSGSEGNAINLNGHWFADNRNFHGFLALSKENKALASGEVESVLTHEFGHIVFRKLSSGKQNEIKDVYEAFAKKELANIVSYRAAENHKELFAECFVKNRFGETDEITKAIMSLAGL